MINSFIPNRKMQRKIAIYAGAIAFLTLLIMLLPQVRMGIIATISHARGRPLNQNLWAQVLLVNSIVWLLPISISFLLLGRLLKESSEDFNVLFRRFFISSNSRINGLYFKILFFSLILTLLGVTGFLNGLAIYSPDSWSYFELSNSIYRGDFYKFNSIRSYYSETYSAAFPFGYPILLAVGRFLMGEDPLIAVWINIVVATATCIIIVKLSAQLKLSPVAGVTLACSLVFWPFYLDEVFSGRSIPLALFLYLIGCSLFFLNRFYFAGLFLGLSALVRFDYLVFAIIFQIGALFLSSNYDRKRYILLIGGFVTGIIPWVAFSRINFGKTWVSDNSWVALSAFPAFVLDYPAAAAVSAFDAPWLWGKRVLQNIPSLTRSIILSIIQFPILLFLGIFFLVCRRKLDNKSIYRAVFSVVLIGASFAPYLLTGYFDGRYFSLAFLVACFVLLLLIEQGQSESMFPMTYNILLVSSFALSILIGGSYLSQKLVLGFQAYGKVDTVNEMIMKLSACHSNYEQAKLILHGVDGSLVARYGAVTRRPVAFVPSNYDRMTKEEKDRYFDYMKPYIFVDNLENRLPCQLVK